MVGLAPTTLSWLPLGLLTSLTLADVPKTKKNLDSWAPEANSLLPEALSELARLVGLKELRIVWINPPAGTLAPALAAFTSLTRLFIRQPDGPEQQAMPCSLLGLTVAQVLPRFQSREECERPALPPLRIAHLTALKILTIREGPLSQQAPAQADADADPAGAAAAIQPLPSVGITASYILPQSLQRLVIRGLVSVEPLHDLPNLKTIELTHADVETSWEQLSAITCVTSVQQLVLPGGGRRLEVRPHQLYHMALTVSALGADCKGLVVTAGDWDSGLRDWDLTAVQGLAGLTGLHSLTLDRMRYTPAPEGMQVTVGRLTAALSALTNLTEFHLLAPYLPADGFKASGKRRAVFEALSKLPSLSKLRCTMMPVYGSIDVLAEAPCLADIELGEGACFEEQKVLDLFRAAAAARSCEVGHRQWHRLVVPGSRALVLCGGCASSIIRHNTCRMRWHRACLG